MNQRHASKICSVLILAALLLGGAQSGAAGGGLAQPGGPAGPAGTAAQGDKVEAQVFGTLRTSGQTDFFIWMAEKADLGPAAGLRTKAEKGRFVFEALRSTAERTQKPLRAELDRQGIEYRTFYIANKILVRGGSLALVNDVAARADVARITANHTYQLDEPGASPDAPDAPQAVEPNLTFINADDVWATGDTGQGMVLAGNDTGLDVTHPAIARHYRGCLNPPACTSWDHNYNWWDATDAYPAAPADVDGHGTHTTGIMVGDDGAGNQIGVAPGAQTIHCKHLNDSGTGTDATAAECLQWDLAPWDLTGSNPDPAKAPDAINNSWGIGGGNNLSLSDEVAALQAAGIVVEASAGNNGPTCQSLNSPADYREVLSTGAVDSAAAFPGTLAGFSSRGPSWPYPGKYYPDVMAPGVDIRSALPGGTYGSMSGTSQAGPHVTALVALMWQANPDLQGMVVETAQLIVDSAVPLTGQAGSSCGGNYTDGPNHDWGHGTIDAAAAVQAARAYGGAGDIIRVTLTGATTGTCGGDWSTPCGLQYALTTVAAMGDELWVAAGVYKPTSSTTDQTAYLSLKSHVAVYGGFAGGETSRSQRDPQAHVTVFSGDIDNNDSQTPVITNARTVTGNSTNSYHVMAGIGTGVVLDGVTITGGYGYYGCPYGWSSQFGGGVYLEGSGTFNNVVFSGNESFYGAGLDNTGPVTVTNSTFIGNEASGSGGGWYDRDPYSSGTGTSTASNLTFTNNYAQYDGAGMNSRGGVVMANVAFTNNWAGTNAGGFYTAGPATLNGVTFSGNHGGNLGGGMTIEGTAPVTLNRVSFTNNTGPTSGGGLGSWSGNAVLNDVVFSGNSSNGDGGGLANCPGGGSWTLNNVLITSNTTAAAGGGMSVCSPTTFHNVTLVDNRATATASYAGAIGVFGGSLTVYDSIIWGNTDYYGNPICASYEWGGCYGAMTVTNSDVQSGGSMGNWTGTNNINADPLLGPLANNGGTMQSRALSTYSPALDGGNPATCLATDGRGFARPEDGDGDGTAVCDMGAYEAPANTSLAIRKSVTPSGTLPFGSVVTYTLLVTNTTGTASSVWLTDTLPSGVSFTQWVENTPGAAVNGGQITWNGALGGGAGVRFVFKATDTTAVGTIVNTVTATDAHGRAQARASFYVPPPALAISKSVAPSGTLPYGSVVTYTVVVSNTSDTNDPSVSFTDNLPGGTSFRQWVTQPAGATVNGNQISWSGPLAGHGTVTFAFQATDDTATGDIVNTATASDLLGSHQASATYHVIPPNLEISKSVLPGGPTAYGSVVTYTIVMSNTTVTVDPAVSVSDLLPGGVVFKQWLENTPGATVDGGQISWSGALAGNSAQRLVFEATHQSGTGTITNTVSATDALRTVQASAAFDVVSGGCTNAYNTVMNGNDAGAGSLRTAIGWACPGSTITFAVSTTIYLNNELAVNKELTIDGSGHAVTISGDSGGDGTANVRVFSIGAGNVVTLTHLTITKGTAANGGGIYNAGTLRVLHSTLSSNATGGNGGGIYSVGALLVNDSTFSGNSAGGGGGGIAADGGSLEVNRSIFTGNSAGGHGGGIRNVLSGTVIRNSTFSGNGGGNYGGGIYHYGENRQITVESCTLTGNSAAAGGGGIYVETWGRLDLRNSTIHGNSATGYGYGYGGGMSMNGGYTSVYNSTITDNWAWAGYSAIANWGGGSLNLYNSVVTGDYYGVSGTDSCLMGGDPMLGALSDNGGYTQTRMPLPGSPTIDAGNPATCLTVDQRGALRPLDGNGDGTATCDIGAVEGGALVCGISAATPPVTYELGGITLTVTIKGAELDCLRVAPFQGNHPLATAAISTGRWWKLEALQSDRLTAATGWTVNLTLPYAGATVDDKLCRYTGTGPAGWTCYAPSAVGLDTLTLNAVTQFSDWAVGDNASPTVIGVHGVVRPAGEDLAVLALLLALAAVLAAVATAITARSGEGRPRGSL